VVFAKKLDQKASIYGGEKRKTWEGSIIGLVVGEEKDTLGQCITKFIGANMLEDTNMMSASNTHKKIGANRGPYLV